jgi:hypothetical protein
MVARAMSTPGSAKATEGAGQPHHAEGPQPCSSFGITSDAKKEPKLMIQ